MLNRKIKNVDEARFEASAVVFVSVSLCSDINGAVHVCSSSTSLARRGQFIHFRADNLGLSEVKFMEKRTFVTLQALVLNYDRYDYPDKRTCNQFYKCEDASAVHNVPVQIMTNEHNKS
uniref:Uncharacterized protein n=1 Tax=Glossina austeni TaxID=7395 RepID=A0A1A9VQ43_GLOAU